MFYLKLFRADAVLSELSPLCKADEADTSFTLTKAMLNFPC
jgi:hypothetical protein